MVGTWYHCWFLVLDKEVFRHPSQSLIAMTFNQSIYRWAACVQLPSSNHETISRFSLPVVVRSWPLDQVGSRSDWIPYKRAVIEQRPAVLCCVSSLVGTMIQNCRVLVKALMFYLQSMFLIWQRKFSSSYLCSCCSKPCTQISLRIINLRALLSCIL